MVKHTQNQEEPRPSAPSRATYGALMTRVQSELDRAMTSPDASPLDVHQAHAEILGYERFLRVSGHHLKLLASLAQTESAAWRTLSDRLAHLPTWESSEGHWSLAASLLATAHDLVATHVGPDQALRTPEIEDLAGSPEVVSSARAMMEHLEGVASAGDDLLDKTGRRQKRAKARLTTARHYAPLRSASHAIAVYGRAARWDIRDVRYPSPVDQLQSLESAPLPRLRQSPQFKDALEALRLLRHLVRAQAHGEVPASPISLRDLALLGALVTDPAQLGEPQANASPMQRLERAHLRDQLDYAHESWTEIADHLLSHTQGLTKAPHEYAIAIEQLRDPLDPALRAVIARALPDLGRRAAETIHQLALQNALVTPQREPGALQAHWRPLSAAHRETLADLFTQAGVASAAVPGPEFSDEHGDTPVETVLPSPRVLSQGRSRTTSVQP